MKCTTKSEYRQRRHFRLRHKVKGTAECPRMCVYLSNRQAYVQFVDDLSATTLVAATTLTKGGKSGVTVGVAKELGKRAAKAAMDKGIKSVVFDRGGFTFGARLKALADAAREEGLKF